MCMCVCVRVCVCSVCVCVRVCVVCVCVCVSVGRFTGYMVISLSVALRYDSRNLLHNTGI